MVAFYRRCLWNVCSIHVQYVVTLQSYVGAIILSRRSEVPLVLSQYVVQRIHYSHSWRRWKCVVLWVSDGHSCLCGATLLELSVRTEFKRCHEEWCCRVCVCLCVCVCVCVCGRSGYFTFYAHISLPTRPSPPKIRIHDLFFPGMHIVLWRLVRSQCISVLSILKLHVAGWYVARIVF
jgi:hypothetical protein